MTKLPSESSSTAMVVEIDVVFLSIHAACTGSHMGVNTCRITALTSDEASTNT